MADFENKNFYELLGVKQNASVEEIREAYLEIARVYHPQSKFYEEITSDRHLSEHDRKLFRKITLAYLVLIDPIKREQYGAKDFKPLAQWESELLGEDYGPPPEAWDPVRVAKAVHLAKKTGFGVQRTDRSVSEVSELSTVANLLRLQRLQKWPYLRLVIAVFIIVCLGFATGTLVSFFL